MKINENIDWELEAPYLASLPRTTPFRVPNQYFGNLQAHIHQSIFVDGLMQRENHGFSIPENYFEELGSNIESRITLDKYKSLSNNEGFKTPNNYFDNLNAEILSKTSALKPKSKVFKLWHSDIIKYAAAACFIIVTASSLYINQQNIVKQDTLTQTRNNEILNEQMLYDIDESVIIEHLRESQNLTTSTPSDIELENYILNHYSTNDLSNNL